MPNYAVPFLLQETSHLGTAALDGEEITLW
jgi:hypothetical protein